VTRYNWDQVEKEQLNPLLMRQVIHGDKMTVARIYLTKGCIVPEHAHANEQITVLHKGKLLFRMAGQDMVLEAGDVLHIPAHAAHQVTALEDSLAMDVFSPPREDWRTGDDAYLRR
jgi:quercetin dioxygenase-like cupin family protein